MFNRWFPAMLAAGALPLLFASAYAQDAAVVPKGFEKVDKTIQLETLKSKMRYDLDEFDVPPGAKVKLILKNIDDLPHNVIICGKKGKTVGQAVAQEAWKLAENGFEKHWIPDDERVLAATKMIDPQKTGTVYFKAPEEEGNYDFVCTFPGHSAYMKGVMIVAHSYSSGPIQDLSYMVYDGDFDKMPDFTKLKPSGTDSLNKGLIDLGKIKKREKFAAVFEGTIAAPTAGNYRFSLGSDDGSMLYIDDELVIDNDGVHGMQLKRGRVKLSEGKHRIKVSYFEKSGEEALALSWSTKGMKETPLSSQVPPARQRGGSEGIPLAPTGDHAVIYRNFIDGAGNRAVAVGYPGGINLAFDADFMRIALMWKGGFMDAARHWNGRGQGAQPPLGYGVIAAPEGDAFAILDSPTADWPKPEGTRSKNSKFIGYVLDSKSFPTFRYKIGDVTVLDTPVPSGSLTDNTDSLARTLTFAAEKPPSALYFRVAVGDEITTDGENFTIDGRMTISCDSESPPTVQKGALLIPVTFNVDGAAIITLTYQWK